MKNIFKSMVVCSLFISLSSLAMADDWPQWLGANRDGVSGETGWNMNWSAKAPKKLWSINVGIGASSVAVVGDRLYTLGNDKKANEDSVWCINVNTGKTIWKQSYPCKFSKRMFDGGTSTTPTVHEGRVYTLSETGQLFCWDAQTGKQIWAKHLVDDFGGIRPRWKKAIWGYACSPLIVGDKLIVDAGSPTKGTTLALDINTGNLIWGSSNKDEASYASLIQVNYKGKDAVAGMNAFGLSIVDLADGKELGRMSWKTAYLINASTPVVIDKKHLLLSSGYKTGAGLVDISGDQPKKIWHQNEMRTKMSTCVIHKGYAYGLDDNKALRCVNLKDGSVQWSVDRIFGFGNVILINDKLIIQGEKGQVVLAEANSKAFKKLGEIQAVGRRSWVLPVLANGKLYSKNNNGELTAFDLSP